LLRAAFDAQLTSFAPLLFYVIIFAIIFIETGVVLAFFLPGDSILFSAGLVAASNKNIDVALLCVLVFLAAFLGDQTGFAIGRKIGRPYLDKRESPRIKKMVLRAERFYEGSGFWAVVAARYFPWVRSFVPPIAGAAKMNYYKFLLANSLGALVWAVLITLAGYYAASVSWVKQSSYALAAFFILASLISALVNWRRHRQ
jgi:membrane-associated protein